MIEAHDQITTMARHLGLTVGISQRSDRAGSKYDFFSPHGHLGMVMSPKEARAWLKGYEAREYVRQQLVTVLLDDGESHALQYTGQDL